MTFAHTVRFRSTHAAAAALLGCALVGAAIAPPPALAADSTAVGESSVATSRAFMVADSAKIVASVPTQINFKVAGDGTLIAPSDAALKIENKSVFAIRVDKIQTASVNGFVFVSDATKSSQENAVNLNISPDGKSSVRAVDTVDGAVLTDPSWSLERANEPNDSVDLTMTGAVANITGNLGDNQQFATINWTFAAGKVS